MKLPAKLKKSLEESSRRLKEDDGCKGTRRELCPACKGRSSGTTEYDSYGPQWVPDECKTCRGSHWQIFRISKTEQARFLRQRADRLIKQAESLEAEDNESR